jgi:hypothetical protein
MAFTLTTSFDEDCFEFKGRMLHVDMSYDNILLLFEMFDDDELYEVEKVFIALQLLLQEYEEIELESYEEAFELFKYVLFEFLGIDLDNKNDDGNTNIKIYDFKKDAELIYASFFAVYKMDLFEFQGKLHWKKFQALLNHLDDNSPFKQVIGFRTMKVPSEKDSSKEYRQHVIKMKQVYSLEDGPKDVSNVFDSLATTFKSQAKGVRDNG